MKIFALTIFFVSCLFGCVVVSAAKEDKTDEYKLAEEIINWSPDRIFFAVIEWEDNILDAIKNKIAGYREKVLIKDLALKSAKGKIDEKEFEKCKAKISRCSDTENLISFIKELRNCGGDNEEFAFSGKVF